MALTDYATINITQNTVGLTKAGFGTGMYVSYKAAWAERTRLYGQYTDVLTDFPSVTGPEALVAAAYFAQSPAPPLLMIGRGANKPTKIVQVSAVAPATTPNYTYQISVKGDGVTPTIVTFTSGGAPTDALWAAGMVTALNAVFGKNFTATGAASPISVTGNAVGVWFELEVLDVNYQTTTETTADPGVAADLTAISAENPNWYGLITSWNALAYGQAAAVWIEANPPHIYVCDVNDTRSVTTASGTGDLMDAGKTAAYSRTSIEYQRNPSSMMAAAHFGKCLPYDPGTETWMLKTLATIPTYTMTATHRANLIARNGNGYESAAGLNVTFNGMTCNGSFIDIRRSLDWMQDTMTKLVFGIMAGSAKVPYTDPGIQQIAAGVYGAIKQGVDRGMVLESSVIITVPQLANVVAADKLSRTLNNVKFAFTLTGAIHKVNVTGSVSS